MSEKYMKNFNGEKIFSLEYDKETLRDMVCDLQTQLQQKENIIKEVREYIKQNEFYLDYKTGACIKGVMPLLEILDKENNYEII